MRNYGLAAGGPAQRALYNQTNHAYTHRHTHVRTMRTHTNINHNSLKALIQRCILQQAFVCLKQSDSFRCYTTRRVGIREKKDFLILLWRANNCRNKLRSEQNEKSINLFFPCFVLSLPLIFLSEWLVCECNYRRNCS